MNIQHQLNAEGAIKKYHQVVAQYATTRNGMNFFAGGVHSASAKLLKNCK
jgi:hypothetical protein